MAMAQGSQSRKASPNAWLKHMLWLKHTALSQRCSIYARPMAQAHGVAQADRLPHPQPISQGKDLGMQALKQAQDNMRTFWYLSVFQSLSLYVFLADLL